MIQQRLMQLGVHARAFGTTCIVASDIWRSNPAAQDTLDNWCAHLTQAILPGYSNKLSYFRDMWQKTLTLSWQSTPEKLTAQVR